MPNADTIKRMAENLALKYGSRDPFLLSDILGIEIKQRQLGELKGFYTVQHNIPYIVINKELDGTTASIVCAHELGHDRLHKRLAHSHVLNEFEMYLVNTKSELEANAFAAHLLIPDSAFALLKKYEYDLYESASLLGTTPNLLEIKINQTPDKLFCRYYAN